MKQLLELAENLKKKGYDAVCFETKEAAAEYMNEQLDQTTIGIGGSATVKEMGLYDSLSTHNIVYWHAIKHEIFDERTIRTKACASSVYISSVNGISMDGDIINIDGCGNRVAGISFGPEDVYFLVGVNKIAEDFDAAMYRARNVAAPLNAKRLNRKTPCAAKADRCYDCNSPERICRNFCVFKKAPFAARYHVVLIQEHLGF